MSDKPTLENPSEYLEDEPESEGPMETLSFTPETTEENIRRTGMAYAAGIALFGSVLIMFLIGWLLDIYLGTSPGFLVGGILLGAILGFYQFFRITSRIFRK